MRSVQSCRNPRARMTRRNADFGWSIMVRSPSMQGPGRGALPGFYNRGAGDGKSMDRTASPLWAMGLMSGTSMDGVDAAWLSTDGDTIAAFGPVAEVAPAYAARDRALLAAAGEAAAAAIARGEA